ncbi:MAG: hypothetical protein LDL41_13810 [Coleofasciculus sp. S288]|nr:hypothetical protein [Coleofasciculus sp. S288]
MNRITIAALLTLAFAACRSTPPNSPHAIAPVSLAPTATPQAAIPSPTGQWLDTGNNGVVQLHFQPVQSDGRTAQFWVRIEFNQPLQTGDRTQVMFQDANCTQGIYYTRYLARFDSEGQSLSEGVPPDANTPVTVEPDSLAGTAFQLTCNSRF